MSHSIRPLAEFESGAAGYWDKFYGIHQNRFFKVSRNLQHYYTAFIELQATFDFTGSALALHRVPRVEHGSCC